MPEATANFQSSSTSGATTPPEFQSLVEPLVIVKGFRVDGYVDRRELPWLRGEELHPTGEPRSEGRDVLTDDADVDVATCACLSGEGIEAEPTGESR